MPNESGVQHVCGAFKRPYEVPTKREGTRHYTGTYELLKRRIRALKKKGTGYNKGKGAGLEWTKHTIIPKVQMRAPCKKRTHC